MGSKVGIEAPAFVAKHQSYLCSTLCRVRSPLVRWIDRAVQKDYPSSGQAEDICTRFSRSAYQLQNDLI